MPLAVFESAMTSWVNPAFLSIASVADLCPTASFFQSAYGAPARFGASRVQNYPHFPEECSPNQGMSRSPPLIYSSWFHDCEHFSLRASNVFGQLGHASSQVR